MAAIPTSSSLGFDQLFAPTDLTVDGAGSLPFSLMMRSSSNQFAGINPNEAQPYPAQLHGINAETSNRFPHYSMITGLGSLMGTSLQGESGGLSQVRPSSPMIVTSTDTAIRSLSLHPMYSGESGSSYPTSLGSLPSSIHPQLLQSTTTPASSTLRTNGSGKKLKTPTPPSSPSSSSTPASSNSNSPQNLSLTSTVVADPPKLPRGRPPGSGRRGSTNGVSVRAPRRRASHPSIYQPGHPGRPPQRPPSPPSVRQAAYPPATPDPAATGLTPLLNRRPVWSKVEVTPDRRVYVN